MEASFLISAPAFRRLAPAAGERGWRSDPGYAERIVTRLLDEAPGCRDLDGYSIAELAALRGEFPAGEVEDILRAIARFFGERPPRVEVGGVEYAVGPALGLRTA